MTCNRIIDGEVCGGKVKDLGEISRILGSYAGRGYYCEHCGQIEPEEVEK